MAIARLHMKVGKTRNASSHACYIAREGKYKNKLEQGEKLEHTEYGNMPSWATDDPNLFWQASDFYERKNGTNYREMEIALPRELSAEQRKILVNEFVQQEIGTKHAYQYAIHNPKSLDGGEQPHVHLMFSERLNDGIDRDPEQYFKRYNAKFPERGGARKQYSEVDPTLKLGKERTEARVNELKQLRDRWEQSCNKHLIKQGYKDNVISMKSYQEQGINLLPEQKQLPSQWRDKVIKADIINFREAKAEYRKAEQEQKQEMPDIKAEIINFEQYKRQQMGHRLQELKAEQQKLNDTRGGDKSQQERYKELSEKNQKEGERTRVSSNYEINKTLLAKTDNELKTIDERVKQQKERLERDEKAYKESQKGLFGFMKKDEQKEHGFKEQRDKIEQQEREKIPLLKSKQELEERVQNQEQALNKMPKMSEQEKREYSQLKESREIEQKQQEKIRQEQQKIEREKQRMEREKEPKQKDKDVDHEM